MSPDVSADLSRGKTASEETYKHPLLWVPTSYFAMGIVYSVVTTAANILFANLGLPNDQAAAYSSLTGLAFVVKPFWAPLLELYRTKRFFVVLMQGVLSVLFLGLGLALHLPSWVIPVVGLFLVIAFAGATQDIVSDGVYVTTLDSRRQAAFTGVQSMCWNFGPLLAIGVVPLVVGQLAGEVQGQPKPLPAAYASAWTFGFVAFAILLAVLAVWHSQVLPTGAKAQDAPRSFEDVVETFGRVIATFFQKRDVWRLLAFAFFYRFGLGLLDKIAPLFLLGERASGGLGLNNTALGWLNGVIGLAAFILGSLLGGLFVSRVGLRRSLLILCLALNVPNVTMLYLGFALPDAQWTADGPNAGMLLVAAIFFIEKLGWGFGAVGHMIYMMQQIAPGPYKTAHYAFATGIGLSLCTTFTGYVSGYIQVAVGYQTFFVIVLLAAIPSILSTWFAPFHQADDAAAGK